MLSLGLGDVAPRCTRLAQSSQDHRWDKPWSLDGTRPRKRTNGLVVDGVADSALESLVRRDRRDLRVVVCEHVEGPWRGLERYVEALVSPQRLRLIGREVDRYLVGPALDGEELNGSGHVADDDARKRRLPRPPIVRVRT